MQAAIDRLIPPSLHGFEKAVAPAFLALVVAIIDGLSSGHFRSAQMEIAIVGFLAASATFAVSNAPDGLARFAKGLVPAVLTVVGVLVHFLVTGDWGQAEWTAALTGLGAALIAYLVPTAPTAVSLEALYHEDDLPTDDEEFASGPPENLADRPLVGEHTTAVPIQPSEIEAEARSTGAVVRKVDESGTVGGDQ